MEGKISITRPSYGDGRNVIAIEIYDPASRTAFCRMQIDMADFAAALTGQSQMPVEMELRGLQNVGKKKITESRIALYPERLSNKEILAQWLKDNHQEEGWIIDTYLGSQRSISYKENGIELRYSVYKFVDE